MAHHKRRRPKHQRSGCLWCKPHKDERRSKEMPASALRRSQDDVTRRRRRSGGSRRDDYPHAH